MILKEIQWDDVDQTHLAQDWEMQWVTVNSAEGIFLMGLKCIS